MKIKRLSIRNGSLTPAALDQGTMQDSNSIYRESQISRFNYAIGIAVFLGFLLKSLLIFRQKIAWDEFFFLSEVHSYQRGELTQIFQTFHVHILGWVTRLSDNEVYQIIWARYFLFLLFIASGILFYLISRHFVHKTGALFSVFCWISFSNVINHGSSLRYDSMGSFLFLLALFALLKNNRERLWAAIAGISMGLSLLFSIKAAIHVVSVAALLLVLFAVSDKKKPVIQKAVVLLVFLTLAYGGGLSIHEFVLSSNAASSQENFFSQAAGKTIITDVFFPRVAVFLESIRQNLIIWWLLIVGVTYTVIEAGRKKDKTRVLALTFLVPLFSLLFYRNAFPYYYVFIMTPALLFCGILPERIIHNFRRTGSKAPLIKLAMIALIITAGAGTHFFSAFGQSNKPQAELLSVIHKMFPKPVSYIDGCSAVASFPKVGFFMSTWGFEKYLAVGRPIFRLLLIQKRPEFILSDTPHLDFKLARDHVFFKINYDFLPEDLNILKENYVHYWGMIWLPGKTLAFQGIGEKQEFEILIPGHYILESSEQIILDSKLIMPGTKVFLKFGKHTVQRIGTGLKVVFRWANLDYEPQGRPPVTPYFYGF